MRKVAATGNLTRDPKLTPGDEDRKPRAFITIAVDRPGRDAGTDYLSFTAFGILAETVAEHRSKGNLVSVTGHVRTGNYDRDGETIYTSELIADRVDFH